ncbi:MAG: SusC/RagA family TonB-linked outer membrane protein [Sphingobacteriales bacterium 44-15]|nr:MAG: SusC/RagA family TonB-linked outer membrane protein [Sphingobacteriales bacterium 44-15]
MKLTAVLILAFTLQLNAKSYSQKISISEKNIPLSKVFRLIEKQTGYSFIYENKALRRARPVSLNIRNTDLTEALNICFKEQPLVYEIKYNTVIIREKEMADKIASEKREDTPAITPPITVKGSITNEKGQPLAGATITIKGTGQSVVSDNNGNYSITVPSTKAVLVFSYVGLVTEEKIVGNTVTINIKLVEDLRDMSEVVVIGYGTVKKRDLTGAVAQVKSKDLNAFPATNVLQALSGRAPGVQVLQNTGAPGAAISVRIRGTNSIQGSNEPLYVVDGFPISGSNPTVLNNMDIESIEILKDASATAIYGSRGANGVVLITTKRGKSGRTKVDFESSYGVQILRHKLELMDAKEYARFVNIVRDNDGLQPYFTEEQINNFGEGYDWQDNLFRKAPMKTIGLNVSAGTDKTQFSISGSVLNQDGIVKRSDYDRYSVRANIHHNLNKKISLDLSTILTRINTDAKNSEGGNRGASMISAALSTPPTLTPYNDDGSYRVMLTAYPFISNSLSNMMAIINEQTNPTKSNRVLANTSFSYKPIPDLTIKILGGIETADDRTDAYTTTKYINSPGRASVSTSQMTSLLSENTITYSKNFNQKHALSALAGFTYQDFISTSLSGSGTGFISNVTETYDLSSAEIPGIPGSGYSKSVLLSYLARVNYSYDEKYLATISFRNDGSSKYSQGNKWSFFPSAALAWRISNEDFLKDNPFISDLKLRASWGYTGSQAINAYATLNQLIAGKTIFGDALYNTYAPGTRLPGNLKWETTEQKDIGIDLGILDNRIGLSVDYYIKNTRDLLNTVRLPSSLGFTTTIRNVGEVQNKGFEFGLNAKMLTGAFKWDINTNVSLNRNKVIKLYNGEDILGGQIDVNAVSDNTSILREGQPIGIFWGYLEDGYTDAGKIKYQDLDKDGSISIRDKTYIGNPNPDFIYGFNSSMTYKNFELSFFIQGTRGNDLLNISSINNTLDYGIGLNTPKEVFYNHWTPTNTNAKYPRPSISTSTNISNRFVEDGSYMRLKNIMLSYNLPAGTIKGISNFQIYVSGQNLLTFTKYSWWDPEVNSAGGANSTAQGLDYYSYPTSKSYTIGIRAGF